MTIKALWDPKTDKVLTGTSQHAYMVRGRDFDRMVRALYFPELGVLYFRFYDPSGGYGFGGVSPLQVKRAMVQCERALYAFIKRELVPAGVKVLFWETGYGVTDADIKY